jgi:hypothetical protein
MRHSLQMCWVHAAPIAAEMVDFELSRDLALHESVGMAVRAVAPEPAVSAALETAFPRPAAVGAGGAIREFPEVFGSRPSDGTNHERDSKRSDRAYRWFGPMRARRAA